VTVLDSGVAANRTTRPKSANSSVENGPPERNARFEDGVLDRANIDARCVVVQTLEHDVDVVFAFLFEFVSVSSRAYARWKDRMALKWRRFFP
jgi:hypothetical protein